MGLDPGEDGYHVSLTAFCLKHGQDKGLKIRQRQIHRRVYRKQGRRREEAEAGSRSVRETSCGKESFTGQHQLPNRREATPRQGWESGAPPCPLPAFLLDTTHL